MASFPVAGFATPAKLPTGFLPTAVVEGDFNRDGKEDLAISNGGDDTIYVYLGNGDGSFAIPEVLFTSGQAPVWLAAAQLRTSGHLDLIAVDGDSDQVEVFSGNGDGTFQPSKTVATLSQTPTFVLAGDFNKDGQTDLAIGLVVGASSSQPQFEVLLGDGNGGFPSDLIPPPISSGSGSGIATSWLATGDVNNDGYLDVVTTVAFAGAVTYVNQAGNGFKQGPIFNPQDAAVAVALGDMNGDGCLDAVETGGYGLLTIAKGNCDGTFTQNGPAAELGDASVAVSVVDVNGDGKPDIVASSAFSDVEIPQGGSIGQFGGYLVSVLMGDGTGGVSRAAIYRTGAEAYSLQVSDLSGNHRPDIITISQTEASASLFANDGTGDFGSPSGETVGYVNGVTNAPIPSGVPQTVDLNGDGKLDVLLIEFGQNSNLPSQVAALLNDGTGKLGAPIRSPISVGPNLPFPLFVAANFRSTRAADLVYISQSGAPFVAFMAGNGDGTFSAPTALSNLPSPYQVSSGDFNGDGKLDFAVFGYASSSTNSTTELDVFLGNGDGTFKHLAPQTFSASTTAFPHQLIAGDFNHDGKLDLIIGFNTNAGWVSSGDDLDLALGNGDGTFQTPLVLMSHFGPVAVADLNHDGYLDLIQARDPDANAAQSALNLAGGPFIASAVAVYLGGPGGAFTKGATYTAPGVQIPSYAPALVGDFNADGNLDIALPYVQATIGRPWERRLQIFQGNGDGTFGPNGIAYQLPAYDLPAVGGDFRGLGMTDLLDLVGATSSINTLSAAPAPTLMITADSSPLRAGLGSATVTLGLPATATETVTLTASDPAVTVPGSLTFGAGQNQQSFSFAIGSSFDATHLLRITANLGSQAATAYFATASSNVKPGVTALIGTSTSGTSSVGTSPGSSIPLFLTLESVDGYSGIFGQFTCSGLPANAECDFSDSSVQLLPGGFAQVAFELRTASSTSPGAYNISVSGSNGEITPTVSLAFGVGGISLTANPSVIQMNGSSAQATTVTATFVTGFNQTIQLTCSGLPAGATCSVPGPVYPTNPSAMVGLTVNPNLSVQDYPFVIAGTGNMVTASTSATLRVSSFSASITPSQASISSGQSATFNVQLLSLNHFSSNAIQLSCQSSPQVTCSTVSPYNSISDGASSTVALKVAAPTISGSVRPSGSSSTLIVPAIFASIGVLFVPVRKRRVRASFSVFGLLAMLLACSSILACGGGSGGSGSGGGTGRNPQTINIAVSAQATTGTGSLQVSVGSIALTVQ